jgi:hypothetical protein
MSPDPLIIERWTSDSGSAELVLYDNGSLRLSAPQMGLDLEITSPWKKLTPSADESEKGSG